MFLSGFVSKCLEHYNFDECHLINDILEDNLPPHLRELPSDTIRIPDEPEPEKPVEYKGKKSTHADAMALLNDKSELATIKELIIHTRYLRNIKLFVEFLFPFFHFQYKRPL